MCVAARRGGWRSWSIRLTFRNAFDFKSKVLLREVTKANNDYCSEDLGNRWIKMKGFNKQLDEYIVEAEANQHGHHVTNQLHPAVHCGFLKNNIARQVKAQRKTDAKGDQEGRDIRTDGEPR